MAPKRLRVFLADDHPMVREGLKTLLLSSKQTVVVGEASDGIAACSGIEELRPDVAVIDVSMPGMSGVKVVRKLRQSCPEVRLLAFTVHEEDSYLREMLDAGASGYALKRGAPDELLQAILTVARGGFYLDPTLAPHVVASFLREKVGGQRQEETLSGRELDVVRLVSVGHSNKDIAAKLSISVKTVETYRARATEKLNLHTRADLVRYALSRGWLQTT